MRIRKDTAIEAVVVDLLMMEGEDQPPVYAIRFRKEPVIEVVLVNIHMSWMHQDSMALVPDIWIAIREVAAMVDLQYATTLSEVYAREEIIASLATPLKMAVGLTTVTPHQWEGAELDLALIFSAEIALEETHVDFLTKLVTTFLLKTFHQVLAAVAFATISNEENAIEENPADTPTLIEPFVNYDSTTPSIL